MRLSEQMCKALRIGSGIYFAIDSLPLFPLALLLHSSVASDKAIRLLFCKRGNEDTGMIFSRSFPVLMSCDAQFVSLAKAGILHTVGAADLGCCCRPVSKTLQVVPEGLPHV